MKTLRIEVSAWLLVALALVTSSAVFAAFGGTGSRWEGENLRVKGTGSVTTCTLNGGTPSTCTATVLSGSNCQCTPVGGTAVIAAGGCAVGLSGTTLTATSFATATNVVNIHCF